MSSGYPLSGLNLMIRSLSVSFNYDDILDISLGFNSAWLEDHCVVTLHNDEPTREVCKKHGIRFLTCDGSNYNFDKGKMINLGLKDLYSRSAHGDTFVIIDSDVLIMKDVFFMIKTARLLRDTLYGINRKTIRINPIYIPKYIESVLNKNISPSRPYDQERFYDKKKLLILGFFQMFVSKFFYPEGYNGAAVSDMRFNDNFTNTVLLEFACAYHIGSRLRNWDGRVSERLVS